MGLLLKKRKNHTKYIHCKNIWLIAEEVDQKLHIQ